jgi:hypothetical protein
VDGSSHSSRRNGNDNTENKTKLTPGFAEDALTMAVWLICWFAVLLVTMLLLTKPETDFKAAA